MPNCVGAGADAASASSTPEQTVLPVIEEELDVRKRSVEMESGVRISKTVEEREQIVDLPLIKEDVEVERVEVNRPIDMPMGVRHEGDTTIIPIVEEVLFTEKRLMLKEEIRVTRRKTRIRDPRKVTLKSEHAAVERIEDNQALVGARDPHPSPADDVPLTTKPTPPGENLLDEKRRQDEELRQRVGKSSLPE
jgi:uncharacterized protein (TIGR02271 family)